MTLIRDASLHHPERVARFVSTIHDLSLSVKPIATTKVRNGYISQPVT
jgi:hypothetical protein